MHDQILEGEEKLYATLLPSKDDRHLHYIFEQLTGVPYYVGPTQSPGGLEFYAEDTLVDSHSGWWTL